MMSLLDAVVADQRVWKVEPTAEQKLAVNASEAVLATRGAVAGCGEVPCSEGAGGEEAGNQKTGLLRAAAKKS